MKKNVLFALVSALLVLSLLTGCSMAGGNPKTVLSKYLNAYYKQSWKEVYQYVSDSDKSTTSLQEYLDKNKSDDEFETIRNTFFDKTSYSIKDIKISGNKAEATVEITEPDVEKMFGDLWMTVLASAFSDQDEKAIDKAIADKMKEYKDNMPMTTKAETYNLVKDKEGWKVFLDWAKEKQIKNMLAEANQLKNQNKYDDALAKYNEVLALDSTFEEARNGKEEVEKKIAEQKAAAEKKDYIMKYLELKDIKSGQGEYSESYFISGSIVNNGDKTLKEVEITVYYLNRDGKAISEENFYPVITDSWSDDSTPLKPGYIRNFSYYVGDKIPSGWKTVSAEIINFKYQD